MSKDAPRQLFYFLGLFPSLEDPKLIYYNAQESPPGRTPVPQSTPPLRGRLALTLFGVKGFLRDLSELTDGLRFCYVDLLEAEGVRFPAPTPSRHCAFTPRLGLSYLATHRSPWELTTGF